MNDAIHFINSEALFFFEKVNASISHELKNILAIISETSGFLDDLTGLAKQGRDLKMSQLERCNNSIAQEVQRGFTTVKQMNQFTHNATAPVKEIDLIEVLELTVNVYGFLKHAGNIQIRKTDKDHTPVLTNPFLFQNLIYRLLAYIFESTGNHSDTRIELVSEDASCVHLIFSSQSRQIWKNFPTPEIKKVAHILGIEFTIKNSLSMLVLRVPYVSNKIVALAKELKTSQPSPQRRQLNKSALEDF